MNNIFTRYRTNNYTNLFLIPLKLGYLFFLFVGLQVFAYAPDNVESVSTKTSKSIPNYVNTSILACSIEKVQNGNFGTGTFASFTNWTLSTNQTVNLGENPGWKSSTAGPWAEVTNNTAGVSTLSQTLSNLEIGRTYTITFQASGNDNLTRDNTLDLSVNGTSLFNMTVAAILAGSSDYTWKNFTRTFTATATTATMTFTSTVPGTGVSPSDDVQIDNISILADETPIITGATTTCIGQTLQLTGNYTPAATSPWTSSNTTVATVSNTGLVTGLSAGTTVITYSISNGCSATTSIKVFDCKDSDGDLILDSIDLDDDNDGILDINEKVDCSAANSILSLTGYKGEIFDGFGNGVNNLNNSWNEINTANSFPTANYNRIATFDYYQHEKTKNAFNIDISSTDVSNNLSSASGKIRNFVGANISNMGTNSDFAIRFTKTITADEAGTYTFTSTTADDHVFIYVNGTRVQSLQNAYSSANFNFTSINLSESDIIAILLVEENEFNTNLNLKGAKTGGSGSGVYCMLDTDGDGIPNHLDLNSDGDSCPDALEGDENVLPQHLNADGSINTTNFGGVGSVSGSNLGVPNLVNSGGVADIGADVGQGIGNSINSNLNDCSVDISVTKTDDITKYKRPSTNTYTITVQNNSAIPVNGITLTDPLPANFGNSNDMEVTVITPSPGSTTSITVGSKGAINGTVNLPANGSIVFKVTLRINAFYPASDTNPNTNLPKTIINTATVTVPSGFTDSNSANNSSTDTDNPGIDARNDGYNDPIFTNLSGGNLGVVTINDEVGGNLITNPATQVNITLNDNGGITGATIAADGTLSIPNGVAAGVYILKYTICDKADLLDCDQAIVTVEIYQDSDKDGYADVIDLDDDNDGILDTVEDSVCSTSVTYFNETFGTGTRAYSTYTNYTYVPNYYNSAAPNSADNVNDGMYALVNTLNNTAQWAYCAWVDNLSDHTGGGNGLMALFNASYNVSEEFYNRPNITVPANTPVKLSFWAMNADRINFTCIAGGANRVKPNVRVEIQDAAGTVLKSFTTGLIPRDEQWHQYSVYFNPGANTSVRIVLKNDSEGGAGNDLVLDDIQIKSICDSDGDTIPNELDLDSDQDGCFDAIEGDENVLPQHLNADGSINTTNFGGVGSVSGSNLGVPNLVNSGGVADIGADVGQGVGNSTNSTLNDCVNFGYIYVHKKAVSEFGSSDFNFNLSSTTSGSLGSFILNDTAEALNVFDLGASFGNGAGQIWGVATTQANSASANTHIIDGSIYTRATNSAQWSQVGSMTNARSIDGIGANSAVYTDAVGNIYTLVNGVSTLIYQSTPGNLAVDVASGGPGGVIVAVIGVPSNAGGSTMQNRKLYKYTGSGTAIGNWTEFTNAGNRVFRVDVQAGTQDVFYVNFNISSDVDNNVYWLSSANPLASIPTSLGAPTDSFYPLSGGTGYNARRDVAVTENRTVFSPFSISTAPSVAPYLFEYKSGTWTFNEQSRNFSAPAGGPGDQGWAVNKGNATLSEHTIFARTYNGNWLDDERIRIANVGNSIMIPVNPGTYDLTETSNANWNLTDIELFDPTTNSTKSVAAKKSTINVAAGEIVHAVYQNTMENRVSVPATCNNSILVDFGSGTSDFGPPLQGLTAYHYKPSTLSPTVASVGDGYYTLAKSSATFFIPNGNPNIRNHTGDTDGYFAIFNASYAKDDFFRQTVDGLVVGSKYQLSFWGANLTPNNTLKPNATMGISDASGAILGSVDTGDITSTDWKIFTFTFTATATSGEIFIKNNGVGGSGNDIAIDDIAISIAPAVINPIVGPQKICNAPLQTSQYTNQTAGGTWLSDNTNMLTIDPTTGVATVASTATNGIVNLTYQYTNTSTNCTSYAFYAVEIVTCSTNALNDINQTPIGKPVTGDVLTNDVTSNNVKTVASAQYYDAAGQLQNLPIGTSTSVYDASRQLAGELILNSDGTYTYTPTNIFLGEVPIQYILSNNDGGTSAALLKIEVLPVKSAVANAAPIGQDDTATTTKNKPVTSKMLSNDSDPDSDPITVANANQNGTALAVSSSVATGTANTVSGVDSAGNSVANAGTIILTTDGTYVFTPATDFVGTVNPLTYTVSDGKGGTDTATIFIKIEEQTSNITYGNDDANSAPKGTLMTANVLTNDTDPDGNTQTVTAATVNGVSMSIGNSTGIPGVGLITINSDGTYQFTPNPDYVGTTSIVYTVCDNGTPQSCDQATLYLTSLDILEYCYQPPVLDSSKQFPSKHGITALSRAGSDNGNWPMLRQSAWTVLEAQTKGFVVNRVGFNNATGNPIGIPASDFVEGMMVYDTTNNCLKLYNGTIWSCYTTQACSPADNTPVFSYTFNCASALISPAMTEGINRTGTITVPVSITGTGNIPGFSQVINGVTYTLVGLNAVDQTTTNIIVNYTGTPIGLSSTLVLNNSNGNSCNVIIPHASGNAVYSCVSAVTNGVYTVGVPVTSANTITLTLNVTQMGNHAALSYTANGVTFTLPAGAFAALGSQNLILTASGTPTTVGANSLTANPSSLCNASYTAVYGNAVLSCTTSITPQNPSVTGTYTVSDALTSSNNSGNYITVSLNVTTPGAYNLTTPVANGISFSATGQFTSTGVQTVQMFATGTPQDAEDDKTYSVLNNGVATDCQVLVNVTPKIYTGQRILLNAALLTVLPTSYSWDANTGNTALTAANEYATSPGGNYVNAMAKDNIISLDIRPQARRNANTTFWSIYIKNISGGSISYSKLNTDSSVDINYITGASGTLANGERVGSLDPYLSTVSPDDTAILGIGAFGTGSSYREQDEAIVNILYNSKYYQYRVIFEGTALGPNPALDSYLNSYIVLISVTDVEKNHIYQVNAGPYNVSNPTPLTPNSYWP